MDQFNIVLGVVSERPEQVLRWKAAAPNRFVTGFLMDHPSEASIPELRRRFGSGQFQVLGELAFQYANVAIDDPILDQMYALAEELDVPVHVHVAGIGGSDDFPIHLGSPLRLSRVLRKFPGLRVYVENAGWPFLEEITSLMYQYPGVYADLSTITWLFPREVFHGYLRGLIGNGLGKRLMFGSDQMVWPETIELAIEAIETADFLTEEQKRDIFYNNAARFLRLSPTEIARHHEGTR
jgi:predicted TIM-barrel fold metal-dependent hydrolase